MSGIFISYRNVDSAYAVAAVYAALVDHFGPDSVFRDCESMALGVRYPSSIRRALETSDVVLAVIGPTWLAAADESGRRCVDDPDDWVRRELRWALRRNVPVVPVLLDDTDLPAARQLPRDIRALTSYQGCRLRNRRFQVDLLDLVERISHVVPRLVAPDPVGSRSASSPVQVNVSSDGGVLNANQGTQTVTNYIGGNAHLTPRSQG